MLPGTVDLDLTLGHAIRQPVGIIFTSEDESEMSASGVNGEWEPSPLIPATMCPAELEKAILETVRGDTVKASEGDQRPEMGAPQEDSPSSSVSMGRPDRALRATLSLEQTGVDDDTKKIADSFQGTALSRGRKTSKPSGRPRGRPRKRSIAKEKRSPRHL